MFSLRTLARALAAISLLAVGRAQAATLTYAGPGAGTAPCNTTLQACITGAGPGDTIEIATTTQIDESPNITQSLTLTSASGFTGSIGSASGDDSITVTDPTASVVVTIENLDLSGSAISATFGTGTTDALTLQGSTVGGGVTVQWSVPLALSVVSNQLTAPGEDTLLDLYPTPNTGPSNVQVIANQFQSALPAGSYDGIGLNLNGTGDVNILIASNIIHDLAGCGCGGTGAIDVRATSTGTSTLNIFNNTIDALITDGPTIQINEVPTTGTLALNVYNNILSNAPSGIFFRGNSGELTAAIDYNDIFQASNYLDGYTLGAHNLAVDPLYVNEATRDYVLAAGSPAIGTGTLFLPGTSATVDYSGEARSVSGHIDMGAYQSGQADVAVAIGSNPLSANLGQNVTLTAAVTNPSPNDAPAATLTVKLPAGLIYSSYTSPQGSCAGVSTIVCTLGDLPAGGGVNVTVVATAEAAGPQNVSASVTGGVPDPDSANDTASVVVTVNGGQDAGTGADAGMDAGSTPDAGPGMDAGHVPDAGPVADSGSEPDSGTEADAGPTPDAGTTGDGGTQKASSGGCSSGGGSAVAWCVPLLVVALAFRRRRST